MIAGVGALVLVTSYRSHAAAERLQHEGDDVAGDEDAGVRERFDVGVFGSEADDNARECEIDSDS